MQSRHIGCSHEHKVPQLYGYSVGQSALTLQHSVSSCDRASTNKRETSLLWQHRVGWDIKNETGLKKSHVLIQKATTHNHWSNTLKFEFCRFEGLTSVHVYSELIYNVFEERDLLTYNVLYIPKAKQHHSHGFRVNFLVQSNAYLHMWKEAPMCSTWWHFCQVLPHFLCLC